MGHQRLLTTDEEIDAALEAAKHEPEEPLIVEAAYRAGAGLDFLMLKLNDGRRLLIPREELKVLRNASVEQAMDLEVGPHGVDVWWPQLDDGLYLPEFLEHRWGKVRDEVAA